MPQRGSPVVIDCRHVCMRNAVGIGVDHFRRSSCPTRSYRTSAILLLLHLRTYGASSSSPYPPHRGTSPGGLGGSRARGPRTTSPRRGRHTGTGRSAWVSRRADAPRGDQSSMSMDLAVRRAAWTAAAHPISLRTSCRKIPARPSSILLVGCTCLRGCKTAGGP
eukprot:scaffold62_cov256-Pinguiococcus_pyrenoidosus.AAC.28